MKDYLLRLMKHVHFNIGEKRYCIGFTSKINSFEFSDVKWLRHDIKIDSWFADPFFLYADGSNISLLVEEYIYKERKGRISRLDVKFENNEYWLNKVTPIVDLETHLSFPFIFHECGETFICPENSASGHLFAYRYDENLNLLKGKHLLIDKPLVDSIIIKENQKYYLMGTRVTKSPYDDTRFLDIYVADSFLGKYQHFQTIENTKRVERGAGGIILSDNIKIRPAQSCEKRYGESLILYQLIFENGFFSEKFITEICPNSDMENGLGLHTINKCGDLYVIDGLDYRYKAFGKLCRRIKSII